MVPRVIPLSNSYVLEYLLKDDRIFPKIPWCQFKRLPHLSLFHPWFHTVDNASCRVPCSMGKPAIHVQCLYHVLNTLETFLGFFGCWISSPFVLESTKPFSICKVTFIYIYKITLFLWQNHTYLFFIWAFIWWFPNTLGNNFLEMLFIHTDHKKLNVLETLGASLLLEHNSILLYSSTNRSY